MISFEALLQAAQQARRGKRHRPVVSSFEFHLERELCRLHHELSHKTWRPGPYRSFFIHEPKKRQISAAPYRDRVVHHALVGVLEPVFERGFIADSYACRRGKGTHAAVHRCQEFSRQYRYVLKADIRKFFPTMDHQILKDRIARKIKDPDVMWLVGEIIDGSNPQDQFCEACQGAKSIAVPCRAEVRLTGESPFGQMKIRSGGSGRPKGSNAPPDFLFEGSYRWKTCGSPGQNGTFSHGRFICRQRFELKQNFVVIVHLSPTYESTLAEILQYSTTTPVMAVRGSHRANTHPTTARLRWSCLLLVPAACSWVCPSRRRCVSCRCRCRSFSPSQSQ